MKSDGYPRVSLGTLLAHPAIALHRHRIFATGKARNFKFGTRIDSLMGDEMPAKGTWSGSRARIVNFKTPSVNL